MARIGRFDFEGSKLVMVIIFALAMVMLFGKLFEKTGEDWQFRVPADSDIVTILTFLIVGAGVLIAFSLITKKSAGRKDILMMGLAILVLWYIMTNVLPDIGESTENAVVSLISMFG